MTDCATKRLWLAEAENALHALMTGTKEVKITFGPNKSVEYTQANLRELRAYIDQLRAEVAECDGQTRPRRAPVRLTF